jgi:Fe-S cluster assembly protein SufD
MNSELFQADMMGTLEQLPGSDRFAAFRKAQLAAFSKAGLPTTRDEDWRYTNLARIEKGGFLQPDPPNASDPVLAEHVADAALALPDAHRLVFVDGFFAEQWSRVQPDSGLSIANLERTLVQNQDMPALRVDGTRSPLAALNAALLRDGAVIDVAADARLAAPIYLLFLSRTPANVAVQPRVLIQLGEHAEASVVIHYAAAEGAGGWLNTVVEAELERASRLKLTTLQENASQQTHTSLSRLVVERDAELTMGTVDFGSALARQDIHVDLAQPGAAVDLFGLFFPQAGQHMDIHTRIDHLAPETRSSEAYRGMAGERGRGVFNGKVVVHPDAQRIDARQSSANLLLGERCEIDTKPELEIYADDVKCSHGATVGELDHDALFYLLSRGLAEPTARALLTYAFANEVVNRLTPQTLRTHVARSILGAMAETGLSTELAEVLA